MSMCVCHDCGTPVDSDEDRNCFVEVGNMRRLTHEIIVCETCRWIRLDEGEIEAAREAYL